MGLAPAYWQDVNGNWLKIQSDQVVWSTNQGQSWNSVANRTWQGPDGWYRFDNDWKLSHSASGTIWQSVDDGMWPSRNGSMFSLGTNGALTQRKAAMGSDASNGWQMSTQEYWTAKNNQWVKYMNGRLLWSTDSGTSWTEVPGGAWQQANGDWYKFNDSQLQVSTDGGITWQDATDNAWQGSDGTWYKYDANGHLMARLGTASTSSSDTSNASSDASTTAGNRAQQMRDDFAACQNFSPRRRTDCFNRQHEMRSERSGTSTQNQ